MTVATIEGRQVHVDDEGFLTEYDDWDTDLARVLAAKSPTALTLAKRAIDTGLDKGFDAGLEFEAQAVAACCATEEQHRAVAHFLGRRSSAQEEGPRA